MTLPKFLPLLATVILAAACGGSDPQAPLPAAAPETPGGEAAAGAATGSGGFDWDRWAGLVNEDPCGWLPADFMASIGVTAAGETERAATGTRCVWKASDGTLLLSAGTYLFDGAANLAGDRREAVRLAGEMSGFTFVGGNTGTVTSIYRSDRGRLSMYPNSDDESVMIVINAHHTMQDSSEEKAEKNDRVRAYTHRLLDTYGL